MPKDCADYAVEAKHRVDDGQTILRKQRAIITLKKGRKLHSVVVVDITEQVFGEAWIGSEVIKISAVGE